jgi:hypothetical protein
MSLDILIQKEETEAPEPLERAFTEKKLRTTGKTM